MVFVISIGTRRIGLRVADVADTYALLDFRSEPEGKLRIKAYVNAIGWTRGCQ